MSAWRLIVDPPLPGAANMARDAAMLEAAAGGACPPTLRLYAWARPTVTLGRFQDPGAVDLHACEALGFDVVRRPTGGRGVLHDAEVTYSIVAGVADGVPRGTGRSYAHLCRVLVAAYALLGVDAALTQRSRGTRSSACYLHASQADVSAGAAKLSGSAQAWRGDAVLQHGSLVIERDLAAEASVFGLTEAQAGQLAVSTRTLFDLRGSAPSRAEVEAAVVAGFSSALEVEFEAGALCAAELDRAEELEPAFTVTAMREVGHRVEG